jgi:di/tricarboxylate transporter
MDIKGYFTLTVLSVMIVGLVLEWGRTATVLFFALAALLLFGVVTPEQALSGFSNEGTIIVALLFVVAAGVQKTGALDLISRFFLTDRGKTSIVSSMFHLIVPVSVLSAFLSNTTVVTVFAPMVRKWTQWLDHSASKFLIPLSYATIFGGMCTLIGTSTNLVIHGLMLDSGIQGLSMFELAKIGVPCAILGWLYLAFVGHKALPDRRDFLQEVEGEKKEYVMEMKVQRGCEFIGKSIQDAGLRNLKNVYLLSIDREDKLLGVVSPREVIQKDDRLIFVGRTSAILELQEIRGLVPAAEQMQEADFLRMSADFVEAVVSHSSPILDKSIKEANFRSRYNSGVIAVHRNGERVEGKIGDIKIKPGDTLLLFATKEFLKTWSDSSDFYLVSKIKTQEPVQEKKAVIAMLILFAMVLVVAFNDHLPLIAGQKISMIYAAFAAAALMRLAGCMTTGQAKASLNLNVLFTIAGAIGVSHALVTSAAGSLALIYIGTAVLTLLITNIAAATMFFPIAFATGAHLGVDPRPFIIAVAVAASASFASPMSYQTNLIVQGAGGYKFRDYLKAGLPLNALFFAASIILIPVFWPF